MIARAFKALRPDRKLVASVAAEPYDVVDTREAREIFRKNPYTFYSVTKPEIFFPDGTDSSSEEVITKGAENLRKMIEEQIMIQDKDPCYYIYEQTAADHTQIGLVATVSANEYIDGKIKKHELTRKDKEEERARHVHLMRAQTGPVFLMYKAESELEDLLSRVMKGEPEYDFVDKQGVRQTIYVVSDRKDVKAIERAFSNIEAFYIADGHHRAAASVRAAQAFKSENPNHTGEEEYNFFLAVIFPHNHLRIYDYNRVVKDLAGLSEEDFLQKLRENFTVEIASTTPYKPVKKHEFGMYLDKKWYKLSLKEGVVDEKDILNSLDVSVLQNFVLGPILGIENPRTDKRIDFIGGIHGLGTLENYVETKKWKVAFSMFPTSVEELLTVADEGKTMPPKSTWFEPKLKSGLFVHLI